MLSHQYLDQRSLALHRLVAEKMRRDPRLQAKAQVIVEKWCLRSTPRTMPYLLEWQRLLRLSLEECLALATEESEVASALRQSSPLACLLAPRERWAFLRNWSAQHAPDRA